jgi:predicted DNA-binding protein (MmcQ/YjbR family)
MQESSVLTRLRQICLRLPEVRETVKWGHPTFEAGKKIFAALDRYEGRPCIAFRTPLDRVDELLMDERFTEAPYAARFGWVCLDIAGRLDWDEIERLVQGSYRLVALKRMLAALEQQETSRLAKRPPARRKTINSKRRPI